MSGLMSKICSSCKEEKSINSFVKDSSRIGKHSYLCKECHNERGRLYYNRNKLSRKNSYLVRTYGVSSEDVFTKLINQEFKCPCCGTHLVNPVVDHCHASGKVRDMLCGHCNKALGLVHESTDTLNNMISYLNKHKGLKNNA